MDKNNKGTMTKTKAKTCLRYRLLGTIPTDADKIILGSKLPTTKQVLLCFLAHLASKTKRDAAKETALTVKTIYDKARIPTLDPSKMFQEVEKLYKSMLSILKHSEERWESPGAAKETIIKFQEELNQTYKFWP